MAVPSFPGNDTVSEHRWTNGRIESHKCGNGAWTTFSCLSTPCLWMTRSFNLHHSAKCAISSETFRKRSSSQRTTFLAIEEAKVSIKKRNCERSMPWLAWPAVSSRFGKRKIPSPNCSFGHLVCTADPVSKREWCHKESRR